MISALPFAPIKPLLGAEFSARSALSKWLCLMLSYSSWLVAGGARRGTQVALLPTWPLDTDRHTDRHRGKEIALVHGIGVQDEIETIINWAKYHLPGAVLNTQAPMSTNKGLPARLAIGSCVQVATGVISARGSLEVLCGAFQGELKFTLGVAQLTSSIT